MARAATVLSETDDDEPYDGGAPATIEVPNGLSGTSDTPRSAREPQSQEPDEFQIVETDDDFRPLTGPQAQPTQDIRPDAAPAGDDGERVRQTKAQRRQAQRVARERSESELQRYRDENAQLRQQFDELKQTVTPRLDQIDQSRFNDRLAGVQREIDGSAATVESAIVRMSNAIAAGDVEAHAAALRDHTRAITRGYELTQEKNRLEASQQEPARQPATPRTEAQPQSRQPAAPDPLVRSRADDFLARNSWIDGRTWADLDSKIAQEIDNSVLRDGFDPREDDYWDELDDRLRSAPQLAHRYTQRAAQPPAQPQRQQQVQPAPQRRGPMVAGSGGAAPQSGKRQVLLSPERKAALMEVGALDREGRVADKAKFNRIARGYEEFDRTNGVARQ